MKKKIVFAALILFSLSAAAETIKINPSETFNYHINDSRTDINISVYVTLKTGVNLTLSDINKTYSFNRVSFTQNNGDGGKFGFNITSVPTNMRNNLKDICFNFTSNTSPTYTTGMRCSLGVNCTTYPVLDFGKIRIWGYSGDTFTHTRYGNAVCINQTWGTNIIIDPDFGYNTKGASSDYWSHYTVGSFFTATDSGTVKNITAYLKQFDTDTPTITMGVWSSTGTKIGQTEEWVLTASYDGWKTINTNSTFNVTAGTKYFVAYHSSTYVRYYFDTGLGWYGGTGVGTNLPDLNFATGNNSQNVSIYVGVDTGGEAPAPVIWLNVSLNVPNNTLINNTNNVTFNYTLISSNGTGNCTLYLNGTATNTSINTKNNTVQSLNASLLNGSYWWNITCWYNTTLSNYSVIHNITVSYTTTTTTQPRILTVTALQPPNNTGGPENNSFNYSVVGSNTTYQNCTLYLNGTLNQSATAQNNTNSTFNISYLGAGSWKWNVSCWINATVYNYSNTFNYTVTTTTTTTLPTALTVSALQPPNNTSGGENNSFNYSVTGSNITWYCNISFNGTYNQSAYAQNNTNSSFNQTLLGEGTWFWNVSCSNGTTLENTSETFNYTVTTTTTTTTTTIPLLVSLNQPTNNTQGSENNSFNFTVIGINNSYQNCTLYWNGTLNQSITAQNNTKSSYNLTLLPYGVYSWNVTCWINATTYNYSQTWKYTSKNTSVTPGVAITPTGTHWIYSAYLFYAAAIMTLVMLTTKNNVLPPLIASILWFTASYTTTNIKFVSDFTVSMDTVYTYAGHPELSYLFIGLGIITAAYTILITLKQLQEVQIIK